MSGTDYLEQIMEAKHSLEDPRDIVLMIDLIAARRCAFRGLEAQEPHFDFASKVICIVFEGTKTEDYQRAALAYRLGLNGISRRPILIWVFEISMTHALLAIDNPPDAIALGFPSLFGFGIRGEPEQGREGGYA